MRSLEGKTAIVTGSSRGIGRSIALELAAHGAAVAVNYRTQRERADEVVAEIASRGGRAASFAADVVDEARVKGLVLAVSRELGDPEILVTNAGSVRPGLVLSSTAEDWQDMWKTNVLGTVNCVREVAPNMLRQRRGSIVCLSSIVAERGVAGLAAYSAAKGGVLSLVRSLAVELGKKAVRVNAVAPGVIDTEMTRVHQVAERVVKNIPLRRVGKPGEVASAVRFLASDDASYITGQVLRVGGGLGG